MAKNAFGTILKMGDGAVSESFTAIAEVTDIQGPSFSKEAIEVTNHGSTDGWREYISGLKDGGEITLSLNWLPGAVTHDESTGIMSKLYGDDVDNYQLLLPDDDETQINFAAVCTAFEGSEPIDNKLAADVTLKISGKPTFTSYSA